MSSVLAFVGLVGLLYACMWLFGRYEIRFCRRCWSGTDACVCHDADGRKLNDWHVERGWWRHRRSALDAMNLESQRRLLVGPRD